MKSVIKKIIKATACILTIVALYFYLCMVFTPKTSADMGGRKLYQAKAIEAEANDSLDVIFAGNSDAYNGINPLRIYDDTGITSFVCGFAKQTVGGAYSHLKKTLKNQKNVKVVVLDADMFFSRRHGELAGSKAYDNIAVTGLIKYHARWQELKLRDFYTIPKAFPSVTKGFVPSTAVDKDVAFTYGSYMQYEGNAKMRKEVKGDLKKIKSLCDKRGIQLVFICVPTASSWNKTKAAKVQAIANEMGVPYYDLNVNYQEIGFDMATHYRDNGNHLNLEGANIVSGYIANTVLSQYGIENKKDSIANWDKCLAEYKLQYGL